RAVRIEAADPPRLVPRIALRTATRQIEANGQQTMCAIGGGGGDELAGAALGVPRTIGVGTGGARRRVVIVGDGVGHAAVEQQSLYSMAAPATAGIGRCSVDAKRAVLDGDLASHA